MIPHSAIRHILADDPATAAIVADRIYIGSFPQDHRLSGITIQKVSDVATRDIEGAILYHTARFQVNCFADTAREAHLLAEAVSAAADAFAGEIEGIAVDWVNGDECRDMPELTLSGEGRAYHKGQIVDLIVQYQHASA